MRPSTSHPHWATKKTLNHRNVEEITHRSCHLHRNLRHPYVSAVKVIDSIFRQDVVLEANETNASLRDDMGIGNVEPAGKMLPKFRIG